MCDNYSTPPEPFDMRKRPLPNNRLAVVVLVCFIAAMLLPACGDGAEPATEEYPEWAETAAEVVLGEPVEGVLELEGDIDYFAFQAEEGELYKVELGLGTLSDWVVGVYDADEVLLGYSTERDAGFLGPRLLWTAPATGVFFVMVSGLGEGSYSLEVGVVDLEDDFADGVVGAARVEVGEAVEGAVDYPWDADYFAFEAVEGEFYEIVVALGTLPESVVAVHDADRVIWADDYERDDGVPGSRLFWIAPDAGVFFVAVSGYGWGTYSLSVEVSDIVDDFADWFDGAARVEVGEAVEGALDYDGDLDMFVFEAVGGELYEMEVALGTLSESVVGVYDADGRHLVFTDGRAESLASRTVWRAPETGDCFVQILGYGEGTYSLSVGVADVVDDYADGVMGAARVVSGEAVEGVLDYHGDVDYFVFEAVGGELYEVEVALGTLYDSQLVVYDTDGYPLGYNVYGEGSSTSRRLWKAPVEGQYFIEVSGLGEGSYSMSVGILDVVDDFADGRRGAARLVLGEAVEGALDYPGDVDFFVFGAVEGEFYEVEVALGTLSDSEVAVYGDYGLQLDFNDDRGDGSLASRLFWTAPLTRDFYVGVRGHDEGSYSLTVGISDIVDDFADGKLGSAELLLGEAVEGALDYVGDVDYFFLKVVEGELYEIEVSLGTLPDSFLSVYDADGRRWDYNDDHEGSLGSRLVWRAPVTGVFFVEVSGSDHGSYTLAVPTSK